MFGRKKQEGTKCSECNLECHTEEKLQKHKSIAHKNYETNRTNRRGLKKGKTIDFG